MTEATTVGVGAAPGAGAHDLEQFRPELTGYCYRMLGSAFEADDAVQETMVRAWRSVDRFEGRSSLRSWMYRIATNVCLDQLNGKKRRALPIDLTASSSGEGHAGPLLPEAAWVRPMPDDRVLPPEADPADVAVAAESVRLAFIAALQHLPPRQRAVLILREVLRWQASEVAELLDTTVVSVNSALQRARARLAECDLEALDPTDIDDAQRELLARYVDAFERYDLTALVALLHEDATLQMPPFLMWFQGHEAALRWWSSEGAQGCVGSRLVPLSANGSPAYAQYRPATSGDGYDAFAIQVLEIRDGRMAHIHYFVDPELFPLFGLPLHMAA